MASDQVMERHQKNGSSVRVEAIIIIVVVDVDVVIIINPVD